MTTAPRIRLSRERVLAAAIGLADAGGIESLSMRRLAQALGVEAMSLYHHVANKDEILDGIVDKVLGEVELPGAGSDWKAGIRAAAISAHDVLLRHPWAASEMLTRSIPARLRYMEAILGSLRRGGFTPAQTDHAYHALDSHIAGFTLWQVRFQLDADTLPGLAARFVAQLPEAEYPYVIEHVGEHLRPRDPEAPGAFAFGLDLILDGLERMLRAS